MRLTVFSLFLFSALMSDAVADDGVTAAPGSAPSVTASDAVLHFAIERYQVSGASLLTQSEINAVFAPFVGSDKDFTDVQRAREALEKAYAARGFSAVRVLLPEQELEQGTVQMRVVESHFGKIKILDNQLVGESNVLNALPSLRAGGIPSSLKISRELKLANENPARQMNVVLKAGEKEDEVDASVVVTDSKPSAWGLTADNTGTPETGRTRLAFSYRYANLFDLDHVASLQYLTSPERPNRLTVLSGAYKIPLYQSGNSLEFFGGYSNVNSVIGGTSNFQGGGLLLSARYNHPLDRIGQFEPRFTMGLDWRDFRRIEMTSPVPVTVFNEVVVMPMSLAFAAQGKFERSDLGFNASVAANLPGMNKGGAADFAAYDASGVIKPNVNYRVARYGANYSRKVGDDWQLRVVMNGQWSRDVLIQGEQFRLGGMDGVRGFAEGSEGGESGVRWNLEGYTPDFGKNDVKARALVFFDAGEVRPANGLNSSIASTGLGLRAGYADQFNMRVDAGRILNAGNDPAQRVGDWRINLALSANF